MKNLTVGKLDFLVNNAGRNYIMPALDVEFDEAKDMFEVNYFCCHAYLSRICSVAHSEQRYYYADRQYFWRGVRIFN